MGKIPQFDFLGWVVVRNLGILIRLGETQSYGSYKRISRVLRFLGPSEERNV